MMIARDARDVRAMSPIPFETQSLRTLINGDSTPQTTPQTTTQPTTLDLTLDLSTFARFHSNYPNHSNHTPTASSASGGAHPSALIPPPAQPSPKRHCPSHSLPPTLPPVLHVPPRPPSPPSPPNPVRAMPGLRHAGLMHEYGGVRRWVQMRRGERPWPHMADA